MKRRNVMVTILLALIALFGAFAFASCGGGDTDETPIAEGPETGEYYCDAQSGAEYTISLHDGNKVDFKVQSYDLNGTYSVSGESFSFSFEAEPRTVSASLRDDVLTVTLGTDVIRFWKKIDYSVVYMSEGAQYKAQTVLNGRTATRPDDPSKTNYVFIEWYTDSLYHNLYDFTQPVRGNLTLYARFEAPIEPEFNVTLDYNGGNVTGPTTVETVGGKLYKLPTPTRDGYTFAGWWVSHFDSAEKLTYRYEEQSIDQPITLYAVWNDGTTPLVSIYEDGLRWSADGVNNSYRVKFTGPSGEEITNRSYGTTSYSYNFAEKLAGEYAVEVTLNGKTAKAYFLNKALSAVSAWSIDNSLFRWNAVPNARSYTLSVDCGDPNHVHSGTVVPADGELKFDFSGCDMPADGIKFTVTASAEGYLSSTSETFKVTRTLDKVQSVTVDEATATLTWAAVKNATGYIVSVLKEGGEPETFTVSAAEELVYDFRTYARGKYTVSVQPTARGWLSPAASEFSYDKLRLASPSNIRVEGLKVLWDAPEDADSYTVTINGETHTTDEPSYDLSETMIGGGITVSIIAQKKGEPAISSPASKALTIRNGTMGAVKYSKGQVTWDAVLGAVKYYVKVNEDGAEQTLMAAEGETSLAVKLTKKGDNFIFVRAELENGSRTDWERCTVTAYAIEFSVSDDNRPVDPLYFAEGDIVEDLPESYRTGYDFLAWYTAEEDGNKYENGSEMGNVDITLYPRWQAKKYTVTLNPGTYGWLSPDQLTQKVTYGEEYTLPIPESGNPTKAFAAWRSSQSSTSPAFTDHEGHGSKWSFTQNYTLYAQWVEIFEFTLNAEKTGWSVSKGEGIQYVTKVTIPEEYGDATSGGMKPVLMVNNFSNCNNLTSIEIPACVQNIALGAQDVAFMNCPNLQSIVIYQGKYADLSIYESVDGVLLRNSNLADDDEGGLRSVKELVFYPLGKTDTTYTVPNGVQTITMNAFKNAKFTKVIIPTSVTLIETDAFLSCKSLEEVEFSTSNGEGVAIDIRDNAFNTLEKLTKVTLPDRMTSFSSTIFYKCDAFTTLGKMDRDAKSKYSYWVPKDDPNSADYVEYNVLVHVTQDGTTEAVFFPTATTEIKVPVGVTSIGSDAVVRDSSLGDRNVNEKITSVVIPDYVSEIQAEAFMDCTELTKVTFGDEHSNNGLNIGEKAFMNCPLTAIVLPSDIKVIGEQAFYSHSSQYVSEVKAVTLPENLQYVGKGAFGNIKSLTSVTVKTICDEQNSAEIFADGVFGSVSKGDSSAQVFYVTDVTLGDKTYIQITSVFGDKVSTIKIGEDNEYYSLADDVLFNKDMTEIVFYPSTKTGPFTIPTTITEIKNNQFKNKPQFTGVVIPATVKSIGVEAFSSCSNLETVEFSDEVGNGSRAEELIIDDNAFANCNNLKTIVLPARTKSIGNSAFATSAAGGRMKGLTSITLNEGLEEIGAGAFTGTALKEINIPKTVTKMGTSTDSTYVSTSYFSVFDLCDALERITVAKDNTAYADIDGVLYKLGDVALTSDGATEKKPTELLYVPMSYHNANGTLEIPNTVNKIWAKAFYKYGDSSYNRENNANLVTVKFQDNALAKVYNASTQEMQMPTLTVDSKAFFNVGLVRSVIFPEGYRTFQAGTIYKTDSSMILESVELPASLERIEASAIRTTVSFTSLTTVTFRAPADGTAHPNLVVGVSGAKSASEGNVFYNTAIASITFPDGTTEIGDHVFDGCKSLNAVTLPSTVTKIGVSAFAGLSLSRFTFESGKTASLEIGTYAFNGVTGITEMSLPTATVIGSNAFKDSSLRSVTFGENLTQIEGSAFAGTHLSGKITLPASLESIGTGAFEGLTEITAVEFLKPETVSGGKLKIMDRAFSDCTRLATINLEDSTVTEIASNAFRNTALTSVTFPWTISTIGLQSFQNISALKTVNFATDPAQNGGLSCLKEIEKYAFSDTGIETFTLPNSSAEIELGSQIFLRCSSLQTVHLSAQVNEIGDAFTGCGSVGMITVDENNPKYATQPNQQMLFRKNGDGSVGEVVFIYVELNGTFTVADKTTMIGASVFKGQTELEHLVLPATLLSIGESAFEDCINLKTVTFASGEADLRSIGKNAFKNCINLETFEFNKTHNLDGGEGADGVGIGASAFENCYKLQSVDLSRNTNLTQFGDSAFKYAGSKLADDVTFTVTLPSEMIFLGKNTFQGTGLKSIDLSGLKNLKAFASSKTSTSASTNVYLFTDCTKLESVQLPESLIYIGGHVFENCTSLKTINLGKVGEIDQYAFNGCVALTGDQTGAEPSAPNLSVDFSALTKTGSYAFANSGILAIRIPSAFGTLGTYTFQNCAALCSVSFTGASSKLTAISEGSFQGCTALTQFTIPASVTTINKAAFAESGLTSITIPSTVTKFGGASVFAECKSLTNATFEDGTSTISSSNMGKNMFENSGVQSIVLGNRIAIISERMFSGCKSLTSITIPSTVTTVNAYAFAGSGLQSIQLPKTVTTWSTTGYQFADCASLSEVTFETGFNNNKVSQPHMFANCTSLTSFTFPAGVSAVADYMFQGSGLEELTIPATITKFGKYSFADCTKLTSITFAEGITDFGTNTFDGCDNLDLQVEDLPDSFTTLNATLVQMLYAGQRDIVIDDRFTSIADKAFQKNTTATSITLPSTVESIGANAFDGSAISSITLSSGLQTIGASAFANTQFTSIEIPETVTSIGQKAFENAAITNISIPSSVTTYGDYLFQKSKLESVELPENMTHITDKMFFESALKSISLPSKLQTIESYAFQNCVDLVSVDFNGNTTMTEFLTWDDKTNLPSTGKTSYSSSIFEGCTSLKGIVLPTSLIAIGFSTFKNSGLERIDLSGLTGLKTTMGRSIQDAAVGTKTALFSGCENLTEVLLPDSLEYIVGQVFMNTKNLTSITLPQNLKMLGDSAFNGSGLTSISIPSTVTTIGSAVFGECADLESVELAEGLTQLGGTMFQNCTSLKTINIPATMTKIAADTFKGCGSLSLTQDTVKTKDFTLSADGHFLMKDNTVYALADGGNYADATLTIPANATIPGQQLFGGTKVKTLVFEEGYTTIPASAFYGIEAEEVVLPESLTTIGGSAFSTAKIGKMTIPATVATISANAFDSATIDELTLEGVYSSPAASVFTKATIGKINFAEGSVIGEKWFDAAKFLNDLKLDNVVTIGKTAFNNATFEDEAKLIIPTSVTTINPAAFFGVPAAKVEFDMGEGDPLTIVNGTKAGESLFGTAEIGSIQLPARLVYLGNYAFESNKTLTSIDLSLCKELTIGTNAFNGCTALENVLLAEGVTEIGSNAFTGCTELKKIVLPEGLMTIGDSAFSGCTALASVKLPETLISIGDKAFENCTALKSLYIPSKVATMKATVFTGWDGTQTLYASMSRYAFFQLFGSQLYLTGTIHIEFNVTAEAYEQIVAGE